MFGTNALYKFYVMLRTSQLSFPDLLSGALHCLELVSVNIVLGTFHTSSFLGYAGLERLSEIFRSI